MHSLLMFMVEFLFIVVLPAALASQSAKQKRKARPQPAPAAPRLKSMRFHTPHLASFSPAAEAERVWPAAPALQIGTRPAYRVLANGMWSVRLIDCPEVALRYEDASGRVTERMVQPRTARGTLAGGRPETYAIVAFCFLRKKEQMFLKKGMIWLLNRETGEMLDLDALISAHIERH